VEAEEENHKRKTSSKTEVGFAKEMETARSDLADLLIIVHALIGL
jgi:hypothetical protein